MAKYLIYSFLSCRYKASHKSTIERAEDKIITTILKIAIESSLPKAPFNGINNATNTIRVNNTEIWQLPYFLFSPQRNIAKYLHQKIMVSKL